jgi:hypothetical protein
MTMDKSWTGQARQQEKQRRAKKVAKRDTALRTRRRHRQEIAEHPVGSLFRWMIR